MRRSRRKPAGFFTAAVLIIMTVMTGAAAPQAGASPGGTAVIGGLAGNSAAFRPLLPPGGSVIQLASDPRIHSAATVPLSFKSHVFTIRFGSAMDREGVEKAISRNQIRKTKPQYPEAKVKFEFKWDSDRILQVTAVPEGKPEPESVPYQQFQINTDGAMTAAGQPLQQPAQLTVLLTVPDQVWKVNIADSDISLTGELKHPEHFIPLPNARGQWIAYRYADYCDCDADKPLIYGLYDAATGKIRETQAKLMTSYLGQGSFYAGPRGFFFAGNPGGAAKSITSPGAVYVRMQDEPLGTGFSRDGKYLWIAARSPSSDKSTEFIIVDVKTGRMHRVAAALPGTAEKSEVNGETFPVTFGDDGKHVYFKLFDPEHFHDLYYRFDWASGRCVSVPKPANAYKWSSFSLSGDNRYLMSSTDGMFEGQNRMTGVSGIRPNGFWLPGSDRYVYRERESAADGAATGAKLIMFDAASSRTQTVLKHMPAEAELIGASAGGRAVYIASNVIP